MNSEVFPNVFQPTLSDSTPLGNGELILVVDDEEFMLRNIKLNLERFNYRVLTAKSGAEAIKLFQKNPSIDLVVTDIVMPDLNGPTVILLLRMINPDVRVIAMSGYAPTCPEVEALHADEEHFLGKPFTTCELVIMIQDTIGNHSMVT